MLLQWQDLALLQNDAKKLGCKVQLLEAMVKEVDSTMIIVAASRPM
jgi:hypothetical protein